MYSDSYILNCVACDGEGSGDGDARTGMLTKPPVQLRGVSTCVAGIFQTGLALLEKELLLYLTTYLRCIVSPWAEFQLATLLVPWKIIYVELAGALQHSRIHPGHFAIKVNHRCDLWLVVHIPHTRTKYHLFSINVCSLSYGYWKQLICNVFITIHRPSPCEIVKCYAYVNITVL